MSYGNYYEEPPRRRTSRALVRLAMFVWLLVFSCVGLRAFAIPAVNDFFYRQVNRVAEAVNPVLSSPLPSGINAAEEARERIEQLALPSLPPITQPSFTINDAVATEYVRSQAGLSFSDATVQFVPGEVIATITVPAPIVGEVTGTVRANARAEGGRVVLDNERIDGPIGSVIQPATLVDALENRLNEQIAQQGRSVQEVRVEQGQATIVFE